MPDQNFNGHVAKRSKGAARKVAERFKESSARHRVIDQSGIEDLALEALLIVKRDLDIEGPMESTVVTIIRRTLTEIVYLYGIQINESRFDTSSRFGGPVTNNF